MQQLSGSRGAPASSSPARGKPRVPDGLRGLLLTAGVALGACVGGAAPPGQPGPARPEDPALPREPRPPSITAPPPRGGLPATDQPVAPLGPAPHSVLSWAELPLDAPSEAPALRQWLEESPPRTLGLVHYTGPLERLDTETVADGNAVRLSLVTECGGDSCDSSSWLLVPTWRRLLALGEIPGVLAVDPALRYLLTDRQASVVEAEPPDPRVPPQVERWDLLTGARSTIAECFSPLIIEGGERFLCRNAWGDLLRFTFATSKLEALWRSHEAAPQPVVAYAWIYPEAPTLEDGVVHWGLTQADGTAATFEGKLDAGTWGPTRYRWLQRPQGAPPSPAEGRSGSPDADGLEQLRAWLPMFDGQTKTWLIDESTASCCAEDSTLHFAGYAWGKGSGGAFTHPHFDALLSKTDADGRELLTTAQRRTAAHRLTAHLATHPYQPLLPAGPVTGTANGETSASGSWLGVDDLWLEGPAGVQWVQRGQVLYKLRGEEVLGRLPLRSKPMDPFCCGIEPGPDGMPPKGATCTPPATIRGLWLEELSGAVVVESGNVYGPDGCEVGPLWQWMP